MDSSVHITGLVHRRHRGYIPGFELYVDHVGCSTELLSFAGNIAHSGLLSVRLGNNSRLFNLGRRGWPTHSGATSVLVSSVAWSSECTLGHTYRVPCALNTPISPTAYDVSITIRCSYCKVHLIIFSNYIAGIAGQQEQHRPRRGAITSTAAALHDYG